MNDETTILGLGWYQPEQWERLLQISDDRNELDDTYEDWKKNANTAIQEVKSSGRHIKKVKINLEDLLSWCNENNIPVNGASRSRYVVMVMQRRNEKT